MFVIEGGDAGVDFSSRYIVPKNLTINILSNITNGEEEMRDLIMSYY
jgi:hypothetical protein